MKVIIAIQLALIWYQLENVETAITAQTVYMQSGDVHGTTSENTAHHIAHEAVARLQNQNAAH